jgi:CDP-6-deoxy-D-xylo-4-hexulose-3-dehydrase
VGRVKVPISGQVTGREEIRNVFRVALSQHYGGGEWTDLFERLFAKYMGARNAVLCNSGSSANLLAMSAIELPPGSKVLTSAVGFPTTVNAIIQRGFTPVFVDADPRTLNPVDVEIDPGEIRAIILAHTLGNPIDLTHYAQYRIPIIEDCCDAVGSTIHGRSVGRVGIMSTYSFYPAHHMTMGEGGAVLTDSPKLKRILECMRDWGRDCWCEPGEDNTCGVRFELDYDHKYTYSRIGYNLKASDFQAAVGVAQLDRLSSFISKRKENHAYYKYALEGLPIEVVEATPGSDPSWFGFAFLTPERNRLARFLDTKGIGNRPIMGGNLTRQPAYRALEHHVISSLDGANRIHEQGLWIGVFPGITREMQDYVIEAFHEFFA